MRVQVTQEHIKNGIRRSCKRCPIALAIHNSVLPKGCKGFTVGRNNITFYTESVPYIHKFGTPLVAKKFIDNFDHRQIVAPIQFDLDVPDTL